MTHNPNSARYSTADMPAGRSTPQRPVGNLSALRTPAASVSADKPAGRISPNPRSAGAFLHRLLSRPDHRWWSEEDVVADLANFSEGWR